MENISKMNTLYFKTEQFTYTNEVTLEECEIIEMWIKDENKKAGKHMLEQTAEQLFENSQKNWCCIVKENNAIVWCIFLMAVEKWWIVLYERGSLFVVPEYRNHWIAYALIQKMLQTYSHIPMYSVTNVLSVKKNNEKLNQHIYTKEIIPKNILEVFEAPWALLDNDVVYANEILHILLQSHA